MAAKKLVIDPKITKKDIPKKLFSIKLDSLNLTNTPANTRVLACNKDDTGVGPSIADANQHSKKICADFPIAPIIKKNVIKSIILIS